MLAGNTPIKNATVTLFGTVVHDRAIMAFTASERVAQTRTNAVGRFSLDLSTAQATLMIPQRDGEARWCKWRRNRCRYPVYLIASGGDAGGGDNPAITLASALGSPPPDRRVTINELTTVVAAFSVGYVTAARWSDGNYIFVFPMAGSPPGTETFPSSGANHLAVSGSTPSVESLSLANQLVDPVTGLLRAVFFRDANRPALVNTLADILHACTVSRGPGFMECRSLFQAASLPDPWKLTPDNTLIAIESIVSKLGRANSALFQLLPPQRPYTPVLDQAPPGWLLSLNYGDLGLHRPTAIRADPNDRSLWILNSGSQTLTELSTQPEDLTSPLLGTRKVPAPVRKNPSDFWFAPSTGRD